MYRESLPVRRPTISCARGKVFAGIGASTLVTGAVGPDPVGWLESTFGPAIERIHAIEPAPSYPAWLRHAQSLVACSRHLPLKPWDRRANHTERRRFRVGRTHHGVVQEVDRWGGQEIAPTGLPGRGLILEVRPHGTTVQVSNGLTERVCEFRVEVSLDNQPRYEATCKRACRDLHPTAERPECGRRGSGQCRSADEIVLDLEHEAPTVTIARDKNATSAAEILATGQPAQAVIVAFGPIGMKTPEGVEVQAFKLTVMPG